MIARVLMGVVVTAAFAIPAVADPMTAEEARKFVSGKVFAFTCFDGTRGAGRVFDDGGAAGAVQFSGANISRHMRLPGNTLQVRGQSICASIKGLPFEPCFNLNKNDERSFRGSISGMSFAYCDFRHQGASPILVARAVSRSKPSRNRSTDASRTEVSSRVATPRVDIGHIDAVKPTTSAASDSVSGLRRSTD